MSAVVDRVNRRRGLKTDAEKLDDIYPMSELDQEELGTDYFDPNAYNLIRKHNAQELSEKITMRILEAIVVQVFESLHAGMRMEDVHLAVRASVNAFGATITDEVIRNVVMIQADQLKNARTLELLTG